MPCRSLNPCLAALMLVACGVRAEAQGVSPTNGPGLLAPRQVAKVAPNPVYGRLPLTVECYARMRRRPAYNILISYEPKSSCGHWELFTLPKRGLLQAYVPGFRPSTLPTSAAVADGQWHHLALVLEERHARIYVDGALAGEQALARLGDRREGGPLVIGALDQNALDSDGEIAWVRISGVARDSQAAPAAAPAPDAATVGLWRFDRRRAGGVPDLSGTQGDAVLLDVRGASRETGIWPNQLQGGMSAALQPMPPAKEVGEARRLLASSRAAVGLKAVAAAGPRDGVLRHWLAEYENWRADPFAPGQLEHGRSRPPHYLNKDNIAAQAYDRHALIWPSDGGPLGTALRRTGALLAWHSKAHPALELGDLAERAFRWASRRWRRTAASTWKRRWRRS